MPSMQSPSILSAFETDSDTLGVNTIYTGPANLIAQVNLTDLSLGQLVFVFVRLSFLKQVAAGLVNFGIVSAGSAQIRWPVGITPPGWLDSNCPTNSRTRTMAGIGQITFSGNALALQLSVDSDAVNGVQVNQGTTIAAVVISR
jgi:hypothetical protein